MSKHILVCSYQFGQGPEGICTARLVRALCVEGARVTVVTAAGQQPVTVPENCQVYTVKAKPHSPKIIFELYANYFGRYMTSRYFWVNRVAKLSLESVPDLIYARARPSQSLPAGALLAERLQKPLVLHYSDPLPSPDVELPRRVLDDLAKIQNQAEFATFTNTMALECQKTVLPYPDKPDWARVLPHVAPEARYLEGSSQPGTFLYLGSFGKLNSPDALLAGFRQAQEQNPGIRMHYVGRFTEQVRQSAQRVGLNTGLELHDYTSDITPFLTQCQVLVAKEREQGIPTQLQTKLMDYMMVDRPLFVLVQENSPSMSVVRRSPDTVCAISDYSPRAVADGLLKAMSLRPTPEMYRHRFDSMAEFSGPRLAQRFLSWL